jgi:hypothetical protein
MKYLIGILVLSVLAGIANGLGDVGVGLLPRDAKYRLRSLLVIMPIATACAAGVALVFISLPNWLCLLLTPLILAAGVAMGIFLVGRILPEKIRTREEQ